MVNANTRVDKWLWAARFFKTRALAREAVLGGKVRLEGHRVKPGRTLKVGQKLSINRAEEQFEITIQTLSDRRVSATLAAEMYLEDPASVERRTLAVAERKQLQESRIDRVRRPDKRNRRLITDFTRKR